MWPDRSITRLGPETRIRIERMRVDQHYTSIETRYALEKGKVWNHIIRLLIGESYFEVDLPKENIVAGVRGTTFEIHLENDYIHAVDHLTELRDNFGRTILLFPGELVKSSNIFEKLHSSLLDTSWNEWNIDADNSYTLLRTRAIQEQIDKLSTSLEERFSIDTLSRELLQYIH
jgi:hypothetical protein